MHWLCGNSGILIHSIFLNDDISLKTGSVRNPDLIRKVFSFGKFGREVDTCFPKFCQLFLKRLAHLTYELLNTQVWITEFVSCSYK